MMIARTILALSVGLRCAACSHPASPSDHKPSATTVARIERKLAKDPCIATLAGTQRRYTYPWRAGEVDERSILVTVRTGDNSNAVQIYPPAHSSSGSKSIAWGLYDIRNDRLTLSGCPRII